MTSDQSYPLGRESSSREASIAKAQHALNQATTILHEAIPGRPPDSELAVAWAAIAQGWMTLASLQANDDSHS